MSIVSQSWSGGAWKLACVATRHAECGQAPGVVTSCKCGYPYLRSVLSRCTTCHQLVANMHIAGCAPGSYRWPLDQVPLQSLSYAHTAWCHFGSGKGIHCPQSTCPLSVCNAEVEAAPMQAEHAESKSANHAQQHLTGQAAFQGFRQSVKLLYR